MFRRLFKRAHVALPTLSSLDAYALWSQNYPPHVHNALMQAEEGAMRDFMPDLRGRIVLDLACGSGRFSRIAHEQGAGQVIAMDNSRAMLLSGQGALGQDAPEFVQASLSAIPLLADSVEVILCGLAVGHVRGLAPMIAEMARVLRTDGVALISDFHPYLFLSGKQRTFTAPDGRTFAVEHYAHLHSDFWSAARSAGLIIDALVEPKLSVDGREVPVVVVYRMHKAVDR